MITPEIYVNNIGENRAFFVDILGFSVKYERSEEQFLYLTYQDTGLMLEGLHGDSRKWLAGDMVSPFGRGVNLQWSVTNIDELYARVQSHAPERIFLPMEQKTYPRNIEGKQHDITQAQFIVQSPDGYLFRFCEDIVKVSKNCFDHR